MKPPWTVFSIFVHSKCYGVLPYFQPEVTSAPPPFLALILAFTSLYMMLVS